MRLSIVIPAYNEEDYLPRTMSALNAALRSIPDTEIVVVDNESTDRTRDIAAEFGARIVDETEHNIAKVRNAGAAAAEGDVLVFLDADTIVEPGVFEKILAAMEDERCLGGSVAVLYERPYRRFWMSAFMRTWEVLGRWTRLRAGALQFCRRDVWREIGGYDTTIYVGEDVDFHWRLDKLAGKTGRFTTFIESPPVTTSSRRWNKMGLLRMLFFTHPITIFLAWRTRWFWKDWYQNAIR